MDQRLALLLGLLAELQRIVVNPLGLVPSFLLQAQGFLANGLQILQRLLAIGFMLFSMLSFELNSVSFELLDLLLGLCLLYTSPSPRDS